VSGGLPPPRTTWPDSGPLRPPRLPHPRHAAGESRSADEPGRAGDAASAGSATPATPATPAPSATPASPAAEPARPTRPTRAAANAAADALANPQPATSQRRESRLERVYVITGGRAAPPSDLDLVTLIVAADSAPPSLSPEQAAIMRLCRRPLSVAELSAHLRLPFSATAVLVADLLAAGLAVQRRPVRPAHVDPELLKQVINGLRRL